MTISESILFFKRPRQEAQLYGLRLAFERIHCENEIDIFNPFPKFFSSFLRFYRYKNDMNNLKKISKRYLDDPRMWCKFGDVASSGSKDRALFNDSVVTFDTSQKRISRMLVGKADWKKSEKILGAKY